MKARAEPTLTMRAAVPGAHPRERRRRTPHLAQERDLRPPAGSRPACTSQAGANTVVMASFTHTSIGPSSASTRVAAASTCSNWLTSVGTTSAPGRRAHLLGGAPRARRAPGEQGHVEAVLGERPGRGPADPGGRPGDHGYLAAWHT